MVQRGNGASAVNVQRDGSECFCQILAKTVLHLFAEPTAAMIQHMTIFRKVKMMFERLRKILGVPRAEKSIQGADVLPEYLPADQLTVHAAAAVDQGCTYAAWRVDPDGQQWLRLVHAGAGESEDVVEPESLEFDELLEPRADLSPDELLSRFHERMQFRADDSDHDELEFFGTDDDFTDSEYEA